MRRRKSTILVAVIVTTGLLTAMAVMLARDVSSSLNLTRVACDRVRVYAQLRQGLVAGVQELVTDSNAYDSRIDSWARLDQVRVTDEQARININEASLPILEELLIEAGIERTKERAAALAAWRGDQESEQVPEEAFDYYRRGYECKRSPFESVYELELVKEFDTVPADRLETFKRLITVYGNGRININTVEADVLSVLIRGYARELNVGRRINAGGIAERVTAFPVNEEQVFVHPSQLVSRAAEILDSAELTPELTVVLQAMQGRLTSESDVFRLEALQQNAGDGYPAMGMTWVFDRVRNRVLFHHQR